MKKRLYTIPMVLSILASSPMTVSALPVTTAILTTTEEATNPIQNAKTFYGDGTDIVETTNEGEYRWYKYKADKKGAYQLSFGYNSNVKVKVTKDINADANALSDIDLEKNAESWSKLSPSYELAANEYLYFGVNTPSNTSVKIIFSELVSTYTFGEASVSPTEEAEIESISNIVISYPDAQTNNTDAKITLTNSTDQVESMIPAQIYEGKLEFTHGANVINTASIKLSYAENGTPRLTLFSEQPVVPGTWYTIQLPENILSFSTEMFFPGSGAWAPIPEAPTTKGFLLHYRGKTAPKLSLTGIGIVADDTLKHLGMVPFWFDKEVKAETGAAMELHVDDQIVKTAPLSILNENGKSIVFGNFNDGNFAPYALQDSISYSLVLPANSVSTTDGTLRNETASVAFSGPIYKTDTVEVKVPTPVEPEMLTFTYVMGDYIKSVSSTPKEKALTLDITPEEGWKVESLTLNDFNVLPDLHGTSYTSPVLYSNATLTATLAYDGIVFEENGDGVAQVEGMKLKAYSQGGKIIVESVSSDDVIQVYTIGGSLIGTFTANKPQVEISVPVNRVYIVKIGNHALKLSNK